MKRRKRILDDLDQDIRDHIEQETRDNIGRGLSPEEARYAALRKFGNVTRVKEETREVWSLVWLEQLLQDLRFALRMLRKSPGFTAVAVLTLALGICANTAIFSLVNAILLKTLAVVSPHELVLFSDSPEGGSSSGDQTGHWRYFSSDDYTYFRDHATSFKELCAFQSGWSNLKIRLPGESGRPGLAHGRLVSGNFFSFLGLNAAAGRLFARSDDTPTAPPAVVLNYSYWTQRFHNDLSEIGKTLELNGTQFSVIGVAPLHFSGVKYDHPDLWIPLALQPQIMESNPYANDPHEYWLNMMARLKPGVALGQANTEVNIQLKQILTAQPRPESAERIANSYIQLAPGEYGISYWRSTYAKALQILSGIVAIVLLIACANVANLLLSRASAREQEISIRLAVGAGRNRLVRQLLTESVLLAVLGGSAGVLVARWGINLLASLVAGSKSAVQNAIDVRVLLFTAAVSILAGILFGLVPALRSSRVDLAAQVKGSARGRLRFGFANGLVVFQIAASLVLLVGAGLFLRTLQKLSDQALGFDEDHIIVAQINPEAAGYKPAETPVLYQALIDRAEAIPGVVSATVSYAEPFSGSTWSSNFAIEGQPARRAREMMVRKELVGPNYFETEGIPILLGRDIGPQDRPGTPLVTVINQTMAREYFKGMNPVGMRFSLGAPFNPKEAMTIVGVAADARYYSLRDPVPSMEFCAALQLPDPSSHNASYAEALELRVTGNPDPIAKDIRAAIAQVSASLPVSKVAVLRQEVSESISQNRSAAELSSAFGMLALLLACIGVYGTMAYRVSRRTHEFGIRIALGARPSDVLRLIIRECMLLAAIGIIIGVPVALASMKLIASQLFGIRPGDPLTFASVAVLLILVALAACYIPARRAMKVDPMVALRYE